MRDDTQALLNAWKAWEENGTSDGRAEAYQRAAEVLGARIGMTSTALRVELATARSQGQTRYGALAKVLSQQYELAS